MKNVEPTVNLTKIHEILSHDTTIVKPGHSIRQPPQRTSSIHKHGKIHKDTAFDIVSFQKIPQPSRPKSQLKISEEPFASKETEEIKQDRKNIENRHSLSLPKTAYKHQLLSKNIIFNKPINLETEIPQTCLNDIPEKESHEMFKYVTEKVLEEKVQKTASKAINKIDKNPNHPHTRVDCEIFVGNQTKNLQPHRIISFPAEDNQVIEKNKQKKLVFICFDIVELEIASRDDSVNQKKKSKKRKETKRFCLFPIYLYNYYLHKQESDII